MHALILGGTGFISTRLVQMLLDAGHRVTILTRGRTAAAFENAERLDHVSGDRTSAALLRSALQGRTFDAAVDMIAYTAEDSRIAVDVLQGCVGRFIHCSTVSVYMVSDEVTCPIREDQADRPLMANWPRNPFGMDYGINKRESEKVVWDAHSDVFPVTVLRPTFVSGPGDPAIRDYFWIQRILDGDPLLVPGSGDHAFQQIYVDDAAKAFAQVLDTDAAVGEAYNVVGDDIYSLNDYLRRLAALLSREIELVHLQQDVFDRLPISASPHGDVFPFNTRRTSLFSIDKIRAATGFDPAIFEDWMPPTIDWYLNHFEGDSVGYDRRAAELDLIRRIRNGRDALTDLMLS